MEKTIKILKKITWALIILSILSLILFSIFDDLFIKTLSTNNQILPKNDPKTGIEYIQPYVEKVDNRLLILNIIIKSTIFISIFDILIGCLSLFKNWGNLEKRAIIKKIIINGILIAIIFFIFYAIINTKMCCGGGGDPSL